MIDHEDGLRWIVICSLTLYQKHVIREPVHFSSEVAYSRFIKRNSDKPVATESSLPAIGNTSVSGNLSPNKILGSALFLMPLTAAWVVCVKNK